MKIANRFPEYRITREKLLSKEYIEGRLTLEKFENELDILMGINEWAYDD